MPLDQMRRYFELSGQGKGSAPALKNLLETQREVLVDRLAQMRWHLEYVERKIDYWAAVESGDDKAVAGIVQDLEQRIRHQGRKANGIHLREEQS